MMISPLTEYWKLLDSLEDYVRYGVRSSHAPMPDLHSGKNGPAGGAGVQGNPGDSLERINGEIRCCTLCRLHETRRNTVPGEGARNPLVMVIGEGPGAEEDQSGRPFVGKAGQYLDKWLSAIGLSRETNCFIGNIVKCRPPGNRDPEPGETEICLPFLNRQICELRPRFILSVGRIASQLLCGRPEGIGRIRGTVYKYMDIPVIPTYHPSGVLRNQAEYKPLVWEDLKVLKGLMNQQES